MIENALSAAQMEAYRQEYAAIDWQREQLAHAELGDAIALSALPEAVRLQYRESRFFQEFANETCLRNCAGAVFMRDHRWLGNIGFYRRRLDAPFLPEELAYIERLNAHTRRVLMQSEYTTFLEDAVGALGGTIDAIYLIDQHGYVQYANAAASRLAADGRLTVQDGRLLTPDKTGRSQL